MFQRRNRNRFRLRPKVAKLDHLREPPHQLFIDYRNRNLTRIHRLAQLLIEINPRRHFQIQPVQGAGHGRVRRAPVGEDEPVVSPLLLQDPIQQRRIFAVKRPIHLRVRAHQRRRMSLPDRCLEARHVYLAQRPLADHLVDTMPVRLLVVSEIMLHIRHHPGALYALNRGHCNAPREKRIFTEALKHASALGHARDVDVGRFKEQAAQRTCFLGLDLSIRTRQFRIPRRRQSNGRRHRGGRRLRARPARSHASRSIRHPEIRNAQPRHARHHPVSRRIVHAMQ